jgi:hypothetical protein
VSWGGFSLTSPKQSAHSRGRLTEHSHRSWRCRSAGERSEPERRQRKEYRRQGHRGQFSQRTLDPPVVVVLLRIRFLRQVGGWYSRGFPEEDASAPGGSVVADSPDDPVVVEVVALPSLVTHPWRRCPTCGRAVLFTMVPSWTCGPRLPSAGTPSAALCRWTAAQQSFHAVQIRWMPWRFFAEGDIARLTAIAFAGASGTRPPGS